jgi:ketosteroid isomerase-like protein
VDISQCNRHVRFIPESGLQEANTMSRHDLVNVIAAGDAAINAENFDAIMTFYADEATLVIEPGRCVTGHAAIRNAFVAIAEHFNHTLRVTQEEILVVEGAGTALVLAKTRVRATLKSGEPYDVLRRATYVFKKEELGQWRCAIDNSYGMELLSSATA